MNEDDPDDLPPDGDEAEAQSEATVMPWIWGALAILLIAAFAAWAIFVKPVAPPPAAPLNPPAQAPGPGR
jgi:hypothetical protein